MTHQEIMLYLPSLHSMALHHHVVNKNHRTSSILENCFSYTNKKNLFFFRKKLLFTLKGSFVPSVGSEFHQNTEELTVPILTLFWHLTAGKTTICVRKLQNFREGTVARNHTCTVLTFCVRYNEREAPNLKEENSSLFRWLNYSSFLTQKFSVHLSKKTLLIQDWVKMEKTKFVFFLENKIQNSICK